MLRLFRASKPKNGNAPAKSPEPKTDHLADAQAQNAAVQPGLAAAVPAAQAEATGDNATSAGFEGQFDWVA